jgi:hypothetical protein
MAKRSGKKAPEMHETQAAYMLAKAAYDTAIAAHNAECKAAGWWDRADDEALDLIEASSERHETSRLFDLLRQAERAMVAWSIASVRVVAAKLGKAEELPTVEQLQSSLSAWRKAVDLAFRKAA